MELTSELGKWSLDSDKKLLFHMEQVMGNVMAQFESIDGAMADVLDEAEYCHVRVLNTFNAFLMLSNSQFIENRVYDEEYENIVNPQPSSSQRDPIPLFKDILSSDLDTLAMTTDTFNMYPLPPVIGSTEIDPSTFLQTQTNQVEQETALKTEELVPPTVEETRNISFTVKPPPKVPHRPPPQIPVLHDEIESKPQSLVRKPQPPRVPRPPNLPRESVAAESSDQKVDTVETRVDPFDDPFEEEDHFFGVEESPPPQTIQNVLESSSMFDSSVAPEETLTVKADKLKSLFEEEEEEDLFSMAPSLPVLRKSSLEVKQKLFSEDEEDDLFSMKKPTQQNIQTIPSPVSEEDLLDDAVKLKRISKPHVVEEEKTRVNPKEAEKNFPLFNNEDEDEFDMFAISKPKSSFSPALNKTKASKSVFDDDSDDDFFTFVSQKRKDKSTPKKDLADLFDD